MYQPQAAQRAHDDGDPVGRALVDLREQIDALDDDLIDLIERRLAASRAVAALKSSRRDGRLWIRPRREQEVIDRLVRRASLAPPPLVEQLWREIMAYSLQAQVRTELVLCGTDVGALLGLARARLGSAAPVRIAAGVAEALAAALADEAIAVVGLDGDTGWTGRLDPRLSIFDWIRDGKGWKVAAMVGRVAPEDHPDPIAAAGRREARR